MGLLSFFEHPIQGLQGLLGGPQAVQIAQGPSFDSPYGQITPPPTFSTPAATQPGRAARVGALLEDMGTSLQGGHGQNQALLQATFDAKRKQQELADMAAKAGLSPQELLAMQLNQKAFGERYASQFGDVVLNQGAVRNRGGVNIAGAPVIGAAGDRVRTTDPVTGQTDYSDPRAPSFDEMTRRNQALANAQAAALQAQLRQQQIAEQIRHNKAAEGLGQQRINKPAGGAHKPVPALPSGFVLEK